MAQMTAAERKQQQEELRARREAERAVAERERLEAMPTTLLTMLARAHSVGVYATVRMNNDQVEVEYTDKYRDSYTLTLTSSEDDVDRFEWTLADAEDERRRERLLEERRAAARAKLTDEDLEALGL